jgi:aryl-alcohol dehydrogenase-like predicted oxidoreductase
MRKTQLAKGLEVSRIGLGCMGLSHGYGPALADDEAIGLIRDAIDMGYTLIDTAETYGYAGRPHANEELVGRAIAGMRDKVVLVTKFGIHFDYEHDSAPYPLHLDSRPETIRSSVEGSLKRLGTDHIDLYLQHRIDPDVEPEEVAGTMAGLIAEGKVLHWGISEANEGYLRRAHAVCPVAAIENRYSMMARWHESLFPTLEELHIGFIAFSPLANGFLASRFHAHATDGFDKQTDYRAAMPQFTDEAIGRNQGLVDYLEGLAREHGATTAQVSLAWMCCKRPWIVPIPGSRHKARLRENAAAGDLSLSSEEVAEIDARLDAMDMSAVFGGSQQAK